MRIATACLLAATLVLTACGREGVALPDSVEVTCGMDGTTSLSSRSVRTHADGIHVRIVNRTRSYVRVDGLGGVTTAATNEYVTPVPPGRVEVSCAADSVQPPNAPRPSLVILDVAGHWIDPEPECPPGSGIANASIDYAAPKREYPPEPRTKALVIARQGARFRADDIVEFAGYPQSEPPMVRFVREGQTTRTLLFTRLGGHLVVGHEMRCTG